MAVEVYYYIPAQEAENAVDCGIKLSRWGDRQVMVDGDMKPCISSFLNPKDDLEKYRSSAYKCLKLEIPGRHCYAADRYLYMAGIERPAVHELYNKTVIPLEKYIFGTYRVPECLVATTVISGQISLLDKRLDSPILYDNSQDLYLNNLLESYREIYPDFNDSLLYLFYMKLCETGMFKHVDTGNGGIEVFVDSENGRTYTVNKPEFFGDKDEVRSVKRIKTDRRLLRFWRKPE